MAGLKHSVTQAIIVGLSFFLQPYILEKKMTRLRLITIFFEHTLSIDRNKLTHG